MAHDVVIKIRDANGDIVAVDEIALPEGVVLDDLLVTITTVSRPPRMQRQERSPLHPRALRLSDIHVGMKIRVCGKLGITKYTAIIAGEPFSDDNNIGEKIPLVVVKQGPLGYEGVGYHEMYATDMGLTPYNRSRRSWWNPNWYTVTAR